MAHNLKKGSAVKIREFSAKCAPELDERDQGVLKIMTLLPISTFSDGVDNSAFKLDSELLGNFVGSGLGNLISNLSNGFDFGFEI